MSDERKPVVVTDRVGAVTQFVRTLRLVWRLLNDPRVPFLPKLIIPAAILYTLSPVDLVPDLILGLGQLDDLAVVMLAIAFFIEACPRDVVEEHRRAMERAAGLTKPSDESMIEGSYRVMPDDKSEQDR